MCVLVRANLCRTVPVGIYFSDFQDWYYKCSVYCYRMS